MFLCLRTLGTTVVDGKQHDIRKVYKRSSSVRQSGGTARLDDGLVTAGDMHTRATHRRYTPKTVVVPSMVEWNTPTTGSSWLGSPSSSMRLYTSSSRTYGSTGGGGGAGQVSGRGGRGGLYVSNMAVGARSASGEGGKSASAATGADAASSPSRNGIRSSLPYTFGSLSVLAGGEYAVTAPMAANGDVRLLSVQTVVKGQSSSTGVSTRRKIIDWSDQNPSDPTQYYDTEEEDYVTPSTDHFPDGTPITSFNYPVAGKKYDDGAGNWYTWTGYDFVYSHSDPGAPVGNVPPLLIAIMAALYIISHTWLIHRRRVG